MRIIAHPTQNVKPKSLRGNVQFGIHAQELPQFLYSQHVTFNSSFWGNPVTTTSSEGNDRELEIRPRIGKKSFHVFPNPHLYLTPPIWASPEADASLQWRPIAPT